VSSESLHNFVVVGSKIKQRAMVQRQSGSCEVDSNHALMVVCLATGFQFRGLHSVHITRNVSDLLPKIFVTATRTMSICKAGFVNSQAN
jgi:hypothetical protein